MAERGMKVAERGMKVAERGEPLYQRRIAGARGIRPLDLRGGTVGPRMSGLVRRAVKLTLRWIPFNLITTATSRGDVLYRRRWLGRGTDILP